MPKETAASRTSSTWAVRAPSALAGYGSYGLNGNIDNNFKAFAPRLGIAYQLTPKTVVRLGYGRSYDIGVFGSNFGHTVTQNLPVLLKQNLNATSLHPAASREHKFPLFFLDTGPLDPNRANLPGDSFQWADSVFAPWADRSAVSHIRPTEQTSAAGRCLECHGATSTHQHDFDRSGLRGQQGNARLRR